LALPLAVRDLEALFSPQALDLLAVGGPALVSQDPPRLAITPALVLAAEGVEALPEGVVSLGSCDRATLGGTMLADYPASPPLRHVEAVLEHQDRTPPARRA